MPGSEIAAAVRWWGVLTALGLIAWPLAFVLLRRLPDRGYAFAKMLGLLGVSYLFWIAGSLGFSANNSGGLVLALLLFGGLSAWLYLRRRDDDERLGDWLREHWRTVLVTELLFAVVFGVWVWVRAQNPSIAATEKPMEFAFLNAIGRSPTFPPLDPWLSGYAISYYYFGYVMMSIVARLAMVPEALAFNLAIAWIVAGTAVGSFGLAYNLIAAQGRRRAALWFGVVAALAVPVAGNLQMGLELLHGNGVGSTAAWEWLDVRDVNMAPTPQETPRYTTSEWWWWRTSRVIHEYHLSGRPEEGLEPIVEVPAFSFVLGDMHPHVLALPFALLSLGVALAWWLRGRAGQGAIPPDEWAALGWGGRLRALLAGVGPLQWILTAVVLGGLSFLNTWDVLIHLFVVLGAFFLAGWYRHGWSRALWLQTIVVAFALVLPAVLLYLPFYLGFRSQAAPPFLLPMLMRPTRLVHYLIIFGLPLAVITPLLLSLATRQKFRHWQTGLKAALGLLAALSGLMLLLMLIIAISPAGANQFIGLANELRVALPARPESALAPVWGTLAVLRLLPAILQVRLLFAGLVVFLLALVALVVMILREGAGQKEEEPGAVAGWSSLPFALLLILTAVLLTIGPEFVYLRDNFGFRLNTTFKFYYQAWIMFGVAAVFGLDYLWQLWSAEKARIAPIIATSAYGVALVVALLFPVYAVRSRSIEYRGPIDAAERQPATLDGLAYLRRYNPSEYEALAWLREQAAQRPGAPPVVLEAVGRQYSEFGRVSANTGLPTVLGWPGHELQWRGGDNPEPGRREPLVQQIYDSTDLDAVAFMLDELGVELIYVGPLESRTFEAAGLAKFRDRLDVAFANEGVTIYRWQSPPESS
jgi:YYY domain-containing protein